jgi:hypothetical protein
MTSEFIDFSIYPQPEWNGPQSVSTALELVIQARDKESSNSAYDRLLYAVGNNHAGTYFPVILAVMPHLETILHRGEPWAQRTVLEALIDLFSSFVPEHETFEGVSISPVLRERISALKPHLAPLATGNPITSKSAKDLLDCLDKPTA